MSNDQFGDSVAISGDNVLVGALGDDTGAGNAGAAYLFQPVPEPLTMLGAGTAIGFGAFFKRELNKKKKEQKDS